jgi:branched-chain amino acid transport system substrate-binding protein
MSTKKTVLQSFTLLVTLVLVVTGCAPAITPTPTTPITEAEPTTPAEGLEPIKFVVAGPMSGDVAELGGFQLEGVEVAVEEINAAGGMGGRPVEIEVFDDKCDSTEAALVASRVANDPDVFAVIGHMCSGATMAAGPIYDEAGLTFLTASSTRPDLTQHGWTHLFRTITHDQGWGPILADMAINTMGKKKVALVYATDDYGVGMLEATRPAVLELAGEVVAEETFRHGDKDFSAQLAKMAEAGTEVMILLTEYTEGALFARQRAAAGMGDVPIICCSTMQLPAFIELGGEAVEGAIIGTAWDRWSKDPGPKELNDKWTELFGRPCNEINAYYYDAMYIMKMAVEKGATRENLHEVLHTIEFHGPTGITKFDENGDIEPKQLFALTVQDGEFVSYDLNQ